jgi:hypothetical protein
MYRAVQELAQRTTMVRAPAAVETSRSSGQTPALISSRPGRHKMLSVPGCLLPWENRSARYAARWRRMRAARGRPFRRRCRRRAAGRIPRA